MQPEPITHSTGHYQFSAKLENDTLSLQLNAKSLGSRNIKAQKTYLYEDLP